MKEKARKMNQNTRPAKRATKKAVYAKYGIVWDGKHIESPIGRYANC